MIQRSLLLSVALLLGAPAQAQFGGSMNFPHINLCPNQRFDAVEQRFRAHINQLRTQRAAIRADLAQRELEFEKIKALTLAEETKASGKIAVLAPFARPESPGALPTHPELDRFDCLRRNPDRANRLNRLKDSAADEKALVEKANRDLISLRITYERFKTITRDL